MTGNCWTEKSPIPTPDARERFTRLHVETMLVLHVTFAAGEFRPGRYIRDEVIGWIRAEEEGAEPWRV